MKAKTLLLRTLLMIIAIGVVCTACWLGIAANAALRDRKIERLAEAQAREDIKDGCPRYFITGTVPTGYFQALSQEFKHINLSCAGRACLSSHAESVFGRKYNETIAKWYSEKFGVDFEVPRQKAWAAAVGETKPR